MKRYHRDGTTVFCYSHADPMTGEGINEVTIKVYTNGIIDAEAFAEKLKRPNLPPDVRFREPVAVPTEGAPGGTDLSPATH